MTWEKNKSTNKITFSKRGLMIAGLGFLVTTLGSYSILNNPQVTAAMEITYKNYTVVAGDSLYLIGVRFGISVSDLMAANNLTQTEIQINQILRIPVSNTQYTVQTGDTLYLISKRFGITVDKLKLINNLNSDMLLVGQILTVPGATLTDPLNPSDNSGQYLNYTVRSGDSLYLISKRYGLSVDQLMGINNLKTIDIWVGQTLLVPASLTTPNDVPPTSSDPTSPSVNWSIPEGTVLVHVKSGQTIWGLAQQYKTTEAAIMTTNHLHVDWVGVDQPLFIPVNSSRAANVTAPKIQAKAGYGEWLDWEFAYWIFDIGNHAVIQDLATGKRFSIKRMGGSNHADCEPLTSNDTQIMKEVFGGSWGWKYRPVLVEVDGRILAASMAGMPHDIDTISDNNFTGHFDLHFLNSRQHNTDEITPEHQANVQKAAGY